MYILSAPPVVYLPPVPNAKVILVLGGRAVIQEEIADASQHNVSSTHKTAAHLTFPTLPQSFRRPASQASLFLHRCSLSLWTTSILRLRLTLWG